MKKEKYERTTNLGLATFLYAQSEQICGINRLSGEQKEIVFVRTDRLEQLIYAYKFPEKDDEDLLVDVHRYEYARRYLLDRINE